MGKSIFEFTEAQLNAMSLEELEALDDTPPTLSKQERRLDMDDLMEFDGDDR